MKPVTIAMVEDDDGHARLIEKNIRRAGVNNEIINLRNGGDALRFFFESTEPHGPVLVLLDLNLPDMNGTDILARLKADDRTRRMPVIILTTTDDQREMQRCYDLGCNVYITKPVQYESFASAIRQLGLFISVMQVPDAP